MNIEKIQRINNLAVELQKQGLASNRQEAISQAEGIFNVENKTVLTNSNMKEGSLSSKEEKPSLNQEKIEKILEKNTKFLTEVIKDFQAKIEGMQKQIVEMNSKLSASRFTKQIAQGQVGMQTNTNIQRVKIEEASAPIPSPNGHGQGDIRTMPNRPPAPKGTHPRSGNFGQDDVSVEKFFYSGSK